MPGAEDPLESVWLDRAKRLLALAQTGQHFTRDPYDSERYEEIAGLARAMLADLGRVPLNRIADLMPPHAAGYASPGIDVRAAVIRPDEGILLVREKTDDKWALPGGFADIGFSPAENVEKEVLEETGLRVEARHLYALRHKARHPYPADVRDFYKLFFLCRETGPAKQAPCAGYETSEARFFAPTELPELSLGRVLPQDIRAALDAYGADTPGTLFD